MSMDYIFFDQALCERFLHFVSERGVPGEAREDEVAGYVVRLPEDIDEALSDAIEDEYDALMVEQMVLAESDESWGTRQVMGVEVDRADGSRSMVRIEGSLGRRLSEHFSPEEVHELVSAIAHSLDNPVEGPLCKSLPPREK